MKRGSPFPLLVLLAASNARAGGPIAEIPAEAGNPGLGAAPGAAGAAPTEQPALAEPLLSLPSGLESLIRGEPGGLQSLPESAAPLVQARLQQLLPLLRSPEALSAALSDNAAESLRAGPAGPAGLAGPAGRAQAALDVALLAAFNSPDPAAALRALAMHLRGHEEASRALDEAAAQAGAVVSAGGALFSRMGLDAFSAGLAKANGDGTLKEFLDEHLENARRLRDAPADGRGTVASLGPADGRGTVASLGPADGRGTVASLGPADPVPGVSAPLFARLSALRPSRAALADDERAGRNQSRVARAVGRLADDGPVAAYAKSFFAKSYDWPDRIERLRESLGELKRLLKKLDARAPLLDPDHPLTSLTTLGLKEPLKSALRWGGDLPSAQAAEARLSRLGAWRKSYLAGDREPLNRELRRLRASGITWKHARLLQMLLYLKALESVDDPALKRRLEQAETIDPNAFDIPDETAPGGKRLASRDRDAVAGMKLMWETTLVLMMNLDPQYQRQFQLYEERTMPRLRAAVAAIEETEHPAIQTAFLEYYTPSPSWVERFLKVREILRTLAPLLVEDPVSPIGEGTISKYTKILVREPGKNHKLIRGGVINNDDFGRIIGWRVGAAANAMIAYKQAAQLRKLISRHRAGDVGPLRDKARYYHARSIYMEQTLLWSMAYFKAAVKSIPDLPEDDPKYAEYSELKRELGAIDVITTPRLAQLRRLAQRRVIKNPTAVARLHYMWTLTKLLMIGIPYTVTD